ncbi:MAG: molybdenum cofactor guanylyltransferase [Nevskiales bacterium]|nr:molybdenum cofactor guanylyltransferase [Nevskiales bacterium]
MPAPMRISGGILAGGEGRRFGGTDKGWLLYRQRPFIAHVLERFVPQVDEVTISANRNLTRYAALGWPVVSDTLGQGPLAGLLRLLETAPYDWLLCVPCDAVHLPRDLRQHLQAAQRAENSNLAVLHDGERAHPTCCLLRRDLAGDLRGYLRGGGRAMGRWQQRHRPAVACRPGPLVNLNDMAALVGACNNPPP